MKAQPSHAMQIVNFIVFEAAWFAAVLGAAHHLPLLGTACVVAAIAWHLAVSARSATEAKLVAICCGIGFFAETIGVLQGHITYASGQPIAWLAPYWLVALWGNLGIALNVTMRWLKSRWWLAALLGAICGPLSFWSGVRLGAGEFVDTVPALLVIAVIWGLLMPVLMVLSNRFDGVRVVAPEA